MIQNGTTFLSLSQKGSQIVMKVLINVLSHRGVPERLTSYILKVYYSLKHTDRASICCKITHVCYLTDSVVKLKYIK